ncbi:MAG: lactate utilization protein [Christensenellales bacterium]|jgi:L-lactate utilization protein LutB
MDTKKTIDNLNKRGFKAFLVQDCEEACALIEKIIEKDAVIGFGGSVTVEQMGLLPALAASQKNPTLYHRSLMEKTGIDKARQYELMHNAPWFVSSANAISATGEIINIDGRGNRVSKSLFGTRNYICVAGVNKIADSVEAGIQRARNIAAPLNTKKLSKATPCAATGACSHCVLPDTICRATVILHMPPSGMENFFVILINQSLGF